MGQKAKPDQVYFNYPIPRNVHRMVKQLSLDTNMSVKDIVIASLVMYVSSYYNDDTDNDDTHVLDDIPTVEETSTSDEMGDDL